MYYTVAYIIDMWTYTINTYRLVMSVYNTRKCVVIINILFIYMCYNQSTIIECLEQHLNFNRGMNNAWENFCYYMHTKNTVTEFPFLYSLYLLALSYACIKIISHKRSHICNSIGQQLTYYWQSTNQSYY